jgi:hypothetical protein
VAKQLQMFRDQFSDKIMYEKKSVKCECFTSGRNIGAYRFSKCDLVVLYDGLAIVLFYTIGGYQIYTHFFFIGDDAVAVLAN